MAPTRRARTHATSSTGPSAAETDADVDAQVRLALATWPQIDPDVEGIVTRIAKAARYLDLAARASLTRVGLTKEEFKVLCALHSGARSHGSLCRALHVSTGAMTNRLDKLEQAGLLAVARPSRSPRRPTRAHSPRAHEARSVHRYGSRSRAPTPRDAQQD